MAFKDLGDFDKATESHLNAIKYETDNLAHYYFLSEIKKDILNANLEDKIKKILSNKKCTKNNAIYGNYLLSKYERERKKYKKELNYLTTGHQNFFQSRIKKFQLGIKYCFEDVLQISKGARVESKGKKKYNEIKPIFIIGVPRCGSTLVEKIIASGKKNIFIGEETGVIENFVNKKNTRKKIIKFRRCFSYQE